MNFEKLRMMSSKIHDLLIFAETPYPYERNEEIIKYIEYPHIESLEKLLQHISTEQCE